MNLFGSTLASHGITKGKIETLSGSAAMPAASSSVPFTPMNITGSASGMIIDNTTTADKIVVLSAKVSYVAPNHNKSNSVGNTVGATTTTNLTGELWNTAEVVVTKGAGNSATAAVYAVGNGQVLDITGDPLSVAAGERYEWFLNNPGTASGGNAYLTVNAVIVSNNETLVDH